jgi:hypothetical protein
MELGGLNRGTVAEHLRGRFLQAFADHRYSIGDTVASIALSVEPELRERVQKRLLEYLGNIADGVEASRPWEDVRSGLKSKTKNLPRRYHEVLERIAEAYYRGLWKFPAAPGS